MADPAVAWHDSLKSLVTSSNARRGETDDGGYFFEWEDMDTGNILSIYFDEHGSVEESTLELDGEVSYIN